MESPQVQLPSFSRDLESWLVHTQAYLATRTDVQDQQAFGAYIAALPTDVIALVRDVALSPPEHKKCDALIAALKKLYARPDDEIYKDIQHTELGDDRPSELFRRMTTLNTQAKVKLPKELLRSIHLSKMPDALHLHLEALAADKNDEQYCSLADRLYQRHRTGQESTYNASSSINTQCSDKLVNSVSEKGSDNLGASDISAVSEHSASDQSVQQLRQEIADMKKLLSQVLVEKGRHQPSSNPNPRQDTGHCWYHTRFGDKALRCTQPCSWVQGNAMRGGR